MEHFSRRMLLAHKVSLTVASRNVFTLDTLILMLIDQGANKAINCLDLNLTCLRDRSTGQRTIITNRVELGGRHSSMVSSAPTILRLQVQVPSTPTTISSI